MEWDLSDTLYVLAQKFLQDHSYQPTLKKKFFFKRTLFVIKQICLNNFSQELLTLQLYLYFTHMYFFIVLED